MRFRFFISSVQKEFAKDRRMRADYIRRDPLRGSFFSVFLFERVTGSRCLSNKSVFARGGVFGP